jgi:hypothetical protein
MSIRHRAGLRRGAYLLVLALAIAGVAVTAAPSPALAATCSSYNCDGKDPVVTGCSSGSYTVTTAPVTWSGRRYDTVELRWSPTCQTNWARVNIDAGGNNPEHLQRSANVYRQSPYAVNRFDYYSNGTPVYGNMLYAPGCAKAEGVIDLSFATAYGTAMQPGCSF